MLIQLPHLLQFIDLSRLRPTGNKQITNNAEVGYKNMPDMQIPHIH